VGLGLPEQPQPLLESKPLKLSGKEDCWAESMALDRLMRGLEIGRRGRYRARRWVLARQLFFLLAQVSCGELESY
jgi:hypothetical protein